MIRVGLAFMPERAFLEHMEELILTAIDYAEIAPETTWQARPGGALGQNRYGADFADLIRRANIIAVAHGVGLSPGTAHPDDSPRQAAWLARVAADHALFDFAWYSEHLGASSPGGLAMTVPVPVAMSPVSVALVKERLRAMRAAVPGPVGIENSAFYTLFGDPLTEADFLSHIVDEPGFHLVLDLHNLYTLACNVAVDPHDYLAHLPLHKVIEIHVSGGSESQPAWVTSGRVMRLDSHDHTVPEAVWQLLETVVPRCPNLAGITLERMEGSVAEADVPVLAGELARARDVARSAARHGARHAPRSAAPLPGRDMGDRTAHADFERGVACALTAADPVAAMDALAEDPTLSPGLRAAARAAYPDGIELTALLIANWRFDRLLRGSEEAVAWFRRDPDEFVETFRAYHHAVVPEAFFPGAEAARFADWTAARTR